MTNDSYAIVIFCSQLCIGEEINPLSPTEWSALAQALFSRNLRPSDLLEYSIEDYTEKLGLPTTQAKRMISLVSRSASISFELSTIENYGIRIITRADPEYPAGFKKKLGKSAPPVLFCAGDVSLLQQNAIGFAGSRNTDLDDSSFTIKMAEKAIDGGYIVSSGGARGVDRTATGAAINHGGCAVEFLADSIYSRLKSEDVISAIQDGRLLLVSMYKPDAGFSVGTAMARNKLIYAFSDAAIVVKSDYRKGGTWTGAEECLKKKYCPLFCRELEESKGNMALIKLGAVPIKDEWNPDSFSSDDKGFVIQEGDAEKEPEAFEQISIEEVFGNP